jgi:hypothetical protein
MQRTSPEAASICSAIRKIVADHTPLDDRGAIARDAVSLMDALQTLAHVAETHAERAEDGSHHVPYSALTLAYWSEWSEAYADRFPEDPEAFLGFVGDTESSVGNYIEKVLIPEGGSK